MPLFSQVLAETPKQEAFVQHHITVIGTGYVGLVAGACLAEFGHQVTCCDIDTNKINLLNEGHIPIYEEGLEEIIIKNRLAKRLHFTSDVSSAIQSSDSVLVTVGTPQDDDGKADLRAIYAVAKSIGENLFSEKHIFIKSTFPQGL